jgi:nucleotide-binding universal stress UspA family protein
VAGDIVLGYDGSAGSKAALASAIPVARAFDATLVVTFGYDVNLFGGEVSDYRHRVEAMGRALVAEAVAAAAELDPSAKVEGLLISQRAVDALLAAAEDREARMIVVGGNGTRPFVGAILGSVPHKLLHHSTIPVLVVPAPPGE